MAVWEQDQPKLVPHIQVAHFEVVFQVARHRHVAAKVLLDVVVGLAKARFGKLRGHASGWIREEIGVWHGI